MLQIIGARFGCMSSSINVRLHFCYRENREFMKKVRKQQHIRERKGIHIGRMTEKHACARLLQKLRQRHLADHLNCYCQLF